MAESGPHLAALEPHHPLVSVFLEMEVHRVLILQKIPGSPPTGERSGR